MSARRSRNRLGSAWIAGLAGFILAGVAWWSVSDPGCVPVDVQAGTIALNVWQLARGSTRKYCARLGDGRSVRFIVARDSDGTLRAVLDACRACYLHNLGYEASGHTIICRYCRNRYSFHALSVGAASCSPFALPFRERAGLLTIQEPDLEAGERLFPTAVFAGAEFLWRRWFNAPMVRAAGPRPRRAFEILSKDNNLPACHGC
jgi:uncharacterized membrane protein